MLTKEDNELLCRVGPGTPMGDTLREYWHPVLLSSELPRNDCDPIRVRLLGENLIAFRDSAGRPGMVVSVFPAFQWLAHALTVSGPIEPVWTAVSVE